MQTDRDRARRAAMGAFALASVFGAGTPALANEHGNANANAGANSNAATNGNGNAYGHADAGTSSDTTTSENGPKCHHLAGTETNTNDAISAGAETHANLGVRAHGNAGVKAHANSGVRAHGAGTAAVRVRGHVDVAAHRRGAVRLQAKREKSSGRAHAAAMVEARVKARKVMSDTTINASAHAPWWLSVWAGEFPTSYQAWLAERANAHNNGWAFGHLHLLVNGSAVLTGNETGNETAGNSTEEQHESTVAEAHENEGNENGNGGVTITTGGGNETGNGNGAGTENGNGNGTTGAPTVSTPAPTGTTGTTGVTITPTGTTGSSGSSGTAGTETTSGSGGSENNGAVLGATTSGGSATAGANTESAAVTPARSASSSKLPFTGSEDWIVAALGALMLLSGVALRRRSAHGTR